MKIQTKLIFAFLLLTIPLLFITSIIFYISEKQALTHHILNHLESVASIQQHRIDDIAKQNAERLNLVASRTQLRLSLENFLSNPDQQHQDKMNTILRDAQASIPDFKHIFIYSPDREIVASSDTFRINEIHTHGNIFDRGKDGNKVDLLHLDMDQNLSLFLTGPLYLGKKFLGVLVIGTKVDNMINAISDYTGLEQTGETVLAAKNHDGDTVFIMPTRFDRQAALRLIIPKNDLQIPINRAFSGKGALLTDTRDYRKVPVLAATRHIEDYDWGIVVKIDKEEALAPLHRLNRLFFSFLAGAVILIIFLSFYLAKQITRPISRLTGVAHNIAEDKFEEQADESLKDEIGVLAAAFNKMTKKLISARITLENNIDKLQEANQQLLLGEERYREIYNTPSDAIFMHDADTGKILDVNQGMLDMYGYTYDEALQVDIGCLSSSDHPYTIEEIGQKIKSAVQHGPQSFEWLARKKDGALFWVEVGLKYTEFHDQRYVVAVVRDISDRKQADEDKKEMEKRLQQAQKMESIGTLAGGIAHDFNNILAVILGYTDLAMDDAPSGTKYQKDLAQVLIAANRAKDLVKQILAFSRQSQAEPIPIDIHLFIKEGLKMLRSSIPTTISITEDIDTQVGVIMGDPTQIQQILMNLCTNAYQAMGDTGGTLSVTLKPTVVTSNDQTMLLHVTPGEYVELVVSDTGVGIGPDIIDKIFDPYFTTKEIDKGTGMGLAIIHGILKDNGGAITVESQLGKGSTFHVYFPVSEKDPLPVIKDTEDVPLGKERILFVDDEELLAEMGKDMLERLGYQVTVRYSSLEALATFQNTPNEFDLVITDQTMPNMTGSDLARRMMQIRPDIPIILCTGYSNLIDKDSAKRLGIKEFTLKPLTKNVIAKLIRKILDAK